MKISRMNVVLGLAMFLLVPQAAQAFTYSNILRTEWWKGVDVSGRYTLSPNEVLTQVRIEIVDRNYRTVASSMGSFNTTTSRWYAGAGHYQIYAYRVAFFLSDRTTGRSLPTRYTGYYVWTLNGTM